MFFTEIEIEIIKQRVKLVGIARQFDCSERYVSQILYGQRGVKSKRSKGIYQALKRALEED